MKERDILNDIIEGLLTEEEAYSIIEAATEDESVSDVEKYLGFSRIEWTADALGASLSEIASWRKTGWPNVCFRCGKTIDIPKFGWTFVDDENGHSRIRHIGPKCPE